MDFLEFGTQAVIASNLAWDQHIMDLSTVNWSLSGPALNTTVPASIPSHVHLDLFNAGVIGR